MSSELKSIKVWGKGGPNPPKVAMLVAELGLPHEIIPISFQDLKKPDYLKINPNGRMPAIYDPNTDITIWESGAICEYLVETYDKEKKFSFEPSTADFWHAKQWLFFQVSGQGPYYGQAAWFAKFHHEQLPSAIERYKAEIKRVTGVLETHLASQKAKGGEAWLVGNRISYADIVFVSWQQIVLMFGPDTWTGEEFPTVKEWQDKLIARPAIKKVMEEAKEAH